MATKIPKRAQIMCHMFRNEIEKIDLSVRGEERVKAFLKAIDFENASELIESSLLVIEEYEMKARKAIDFYYALQKKGLQGDFSQYYTQLWSDFREWSRCEEVRKEAGKPTGATDIFKMYYFLIHSK